MLVSHENPLRRDFQHKRRSPAGKSTQTSVDGEGFATSAMVCVFIPKRSFVESFFWLSRACLGRYGTKLVRYQCPREVEGRAHLHRYNRPRADEDRHIGMRVALIQYSRPYVRPLTMLQQQSGTSSRERPDRLHMRKKQRNSFFHLFK